MLTNEALHERKWGNYRSLGKLLSDHQSASHYYGFSYVSDNIFSWLNRLAEVAVTAREHAESILADTDIELASRLPEDLEHLERELLGASHFFTEHAEFIRGLCGEAHEQQHRRRHEAEIQRQNSNE